MKILRKVLLPLAVVFLTSACRPLLQRRPYTPPPPEPYRAYFWERVLKERGLAGDATPPKVPPHGRSGAPIVAVFDMPPSTTGLDEETLEALTDYIAIQLTASGGFAVVPRADLRSRIAEAKAESYRPCFDESCRIELGKALAAEKSLSPTIIRTGRRCRIAATMYDLRTEVAEHAAAVDSLCSEEALLDGVDRLVAKLATRS